MKSTTANIKSRNIYISKYFMAVKNCISIFVLSLLMKDTSLLTCQYIIGKVRNGRKFKCENKPFIVFILIHRFFFI